MKEGATMKKIWNALLYGDSETRKCIGGVIFFCILGIGLIIFSGLTAQFGFFIFGMISGVVALIISQTFTLVDDSFVAEVDEKGNKDTVRSFSVQKVGQSMTSREITAKQNAQKEADEKKKEANEKKLAGTEDELEDIDNGKSQGRAPKAFSHYNEQVLKKIKRKYHVRRDHRAIIIDSSKTFGIKECPAFIWRAYNKVYILLLEKEPRKIALSRDSILHMEYEPNVRGDKSQEYMAFKEDSLVSVLFEGYLPDYFDSKVRGTKLKHKNLYKLSPDILISNRSASTVMDLLYLNFMPDDKITKSEKLNGFFKRVYSAHIMYQDRVYSITEYKDSVEQILKEMCYSEVPMREFEVTLENLVKGRMISMEYADHYLDMKKKLDTKMVTVTTKK